VYLAFPWGDGPLVGHVGLLAPGGNGRPRFYVAASAAVFAGGTSPSQLSIWEWNGVAALPLFIESFRGSFDAPGLEIEQDTVRIHTKGEYKSFFSCGTCPEPKVVWTIRLTPDAVQDLGRKHAVPELELVDKLWSGVSHGRNVDAVASPQVIEAVKLVTADVASDQESPSAYSPGMLGDWKVVREDGRDVLYFSADNLTCGPLRFELERRSTGPYLSHLEVLGPCGNETDPNSK
jgi:hypothetical protein